MIILCRDDLTPEQLERIRSAVSGLGFRWYERREGVPSYEECCPAGARPGRALGA